MKHYAFYALGGLFLLAQGCAGADASQTDDETAASEDELRTSVTPGTFKLYARPNAAINAACDEFTRLTLTRTSSGSSARFEEKLEGTCKKLVLPNARSYRLRQTGTSCGSKTYEGTRTTSSGKATIKITDHRSRLCEDVVPALVIVEEKDARGTVVKKYAAPEAKTAEITGTLTSVMGIGGESTGMMIMSRQGNRELILDAGERNLFEDGKIARVRGTLTTLSGVETRNRPAIDVSEMLVCPDAGTNVNCMPGPNVRLSSMCASGNRTWIVNNCAAVTFAF